MRVSPAATPGGDGACALLGDPPGHGPPWFALLKPAVKSAAQDGVAGAMRSAKATAAKAQQTAAAAAACNQALGEKLVEKGVLKPSDVADVVPPAGGR